MVKMEKSLLRVKVLRLLLLFVVFSTVVVFFIYSLPSSDESSMATFNQGIFSAWPMQSNMNGESHGADDQHAAKVSSNGHHFTRDSREYRTHVLRNKIKRLSSNRLQSDDPVMLANATKNLPKNAAQNIHIFYSIPVDWSNQTTAFYPELGFYQPDNRTIRHHLQNIQMIGANVLIVTWSPMSPDQLIALLFDEAHKFGIRIAIEIDNYPNRTAPSIFNNIQYFYKEFWRHRSLYKVFVTSFGNYTPMFYMKDADCLPANEWKKLLADDGEMSLRNAFDDAVFVGHISTRKDVALIKSANFNGFYSRMVSNGATYGGTWKYWSELKKSANKLKLVFIPTVGPGYDENSKQPKIASTRRHRTNGQYYGVAWRTAMAIGAEFISIASYNDWLAGTQIEEAIPKNGFKDYTPGASTKYIDLTRYWINEYVQSWHTDTMRRVVDVNICSSYFNNTIC